MIFEEVEDGMMIEIDHHEMMYMDVEKFMSLILMARHMYRSHANADMDHDDRKEI